MRRDAAGLAALLATTGVLHLAVPKPFDRIVPRSLPGSPRTWTYLSGVAELAVAAAVAHPRTRRAIAYGRLPLQAPLIAWAWRVSR